MTVCTATARTDSAPDTWPHSSIATQPKTEDLMRDKDNAVPDRDVANEDRDNLKTDTEQVNRPGESGDSGC